MGRLIVGLDLINLKGEKKRRVFPLKFETYRHLQCYQEKMLDNSIVNKRLLILIKG